MSVSPLHLPNVLNTNFRSCSVTFTLQLAMQSIWILSLSPLYRRSFHCSDCTAWVGEVAAKPIQTGSVAHRYIHLQSKIDAIVLVANLSCTASLRIRQIYRRTNQTFIVSPRESRHDTRTGLRVPQLHCLPHVSSLADLAAWLTEWPGRPSTGQIILTPVGAGRGGSRSQPT